MAAIRLATPDDYAAFAALFPELGTGDPVPNRERFAEVPGQILVAGDEGRCQAFVFYERLARAGYVRQIVVDPSQRRRGLGRMLLAEVARRLASVRATEWHLNVKPTNEPALRLY
jgi:ribosomal protein S18 acetylase RimI-like enzyme